MSLKYPLVDALAGVGDVEDQVRRVGQRSRWFRTFTFDQWQQIMFLKARPFLIIRIKYMFIFKR